MPFPTSYFHANFVRPSAHLPRVSVSPRNFEIFGRTLLALTRVRQAARINLLIIPGNDKAQLSLIVGLEVVLSRVSPLARPSRKQFTDTFRAGRQQLRRSLRNHQENGIWQRARLAYMFWLRSPTFLWEPSKRSDTRKLRVERNCRPTPSRRLAIAATIRCLRVSGSAEDGRQASSFSRIP